MFGIVILNYVNFNETEEAIENLALQAWFETVKIYVIENGSKNSSLERLTKLQKKFGFELIVSKENLGFARGANLGIDAARRDGCDYIMEVNSDARIVLGQPYFLEKITALYEADVRIALITPDIKNLDGMPQNPMNRRRFTNLQILFFKIFFYFRLDRLYFWVRTDLFFNQISWYVHKRNERRKQALAHTLPDSGFIYAALGSCQILTPTFFKHFDGHDNRTFLYCEEYILAEHLDIKGLYTWFENSISVLHRESQSVEAVTKNQKDKIKFLLRHMFQSGRTFIGMLKLWR